MRLRVRLQAVAEPANSFATVREANLVPQLAQPLGELAPLFAVQRSGRSGSPRAVRNPPAAPDLAAGRVLLDQRPAAAARAGARGRARSVSPDSSSRDPKPDRRPRHPRRPRHRRDPTAAIRARLRRRPQAALPLIQLARQRPNRSPIASLIDHTPQFYTTHPIPAALFIYGPLELTEQRGAIGLKTRVRISGLCTIPGMERRTAKPVLAEIGTDMSRFPSERHLASWAGHCPVTTAPPASVAQ